MTELEPKNLTDEQLVERADYLGTVITHFESRLVETLSEIENRFDNIEITTEDLIQSHRIIPFIPRYRGGDEAA